MPTDFNIAVQVVLSNEGGYVNNPADPGGETNFGISKRSYPNVDIASLTKEAAAEIYRHDFWQYGDLSSQALATKCLDLTVNIGKRNGVELIQTALCTIKRPVGVDGQWGPHTQDALNSCLESEILPEIRTEQIAHYVHWAAQNPLRYQFLKGLIRRANSC